MALDDSSIAILGGEIPTQDGIAISPDMKTYNLDNDAWTEQPGNIQRACMFFYTRYIYKRNTKQ